ncbi:hypothetical protein FACS189479_04430 [Spirochaetia bacterium]|nr:hypothetical protein FACS189479_04430 [Spirochaetia bacterium]
MAIEITTGSYNAGTTESPKYYGPGKILTKLKPEEEKRLIALGVAKPAEKAADSDDDEDTKNLTPEEKKAKKAEKKHAALVAAAVKKGIGTEADLNALTDDQIKDLLKA